jgi:hypothetical protein
MVMEHDNELDAAGREWLEEQATEPEKRGRELTKLEKRQAIDCFANGLNKRDTCRALQVSEETFSLSCKLDELFRQNLKEVRDNQCLWVEQELVKVAWHKQKTTKRTYIMKKNRDGTPALNKHGRPIMILVKREETEHPPQVEAMMKFLIAHNPEKYGKLKPMLEAKGDDVLPPDEMVNEIRSILKKRTA